ncbi:MAG: hypothetical protein RBS68_07240 [Anaerolineales bacterium]|nr:hypothetical protein [Anaerolineales bacterium]
MMTMFLGWGALTVAMLGGGKLLWDILTDGMQMAGLWAKVISLSLAFLLGWVVSIVCIRSYANLVLPLIIKVYVFVAASGILILYGRVVHKLYIGVFNPDVHYLRYSAAIGIGFAVLVGLHLIMEDHDLRPFSIPFLFGGVMHLTAMVTHYVFMEGKQENIVGDVYFFGLVMLISLLMLAHFGIFNLPRRLIRYFFIRNSRTLSPSAQELQ